jgi:hypothetical protein
VTVRHGVGDRSRDSQHIQVRELLFSPEPPPPIANAGVVPEPLRQRPSIQPFQNHESHSLARCSGPQQLDNVGMVQTRVDRQLPLNLVDGQGHVLALGLERLDHHRTTIEDGRMNPGVAAVGQVLDVAELSPLQVQGGARDREPIQPGLLESHHSTPSPAGDMLGLGQVVVVLVVERPQGLVGSWTCPTCPATHARSKKQGGAIPIQQPVFRKGVDRRNARCQ